MSFVENFEKYNKIEFHGVRLPEIRIDKKYYSQYSIKEDVSNTEFLKQLCNKKFKEFNLHKRENKEEYINRVKTEMEIISELGYVDYFLMIWDVCNWANENGIATGHGRGSCAGSLVMYLIGVTKIDPLKHGCFFERFISKARAKKIIVDGVTYFDGSLLCDVDTDFDYYRRKEVIEYINRRYPNRVAKVLTVATLTGKIVIKDCMKIAAEYDEEDAKHVSDMIGKKFGNVFSLDEAYNESKDFQSWVNREKSPLRFVSNREVFKIAKKLEYLPCNYGVHASAIAITYDDINKSIPLQLTKDGEIVSGFDKKWMEQVSVKLDILGLKTLSVMDEVCKEVGIKLEEINYDDNGIYEFLQDFKHRCGVFQLEAEAQGNASKDIKPLNIDELSDVLAIARPGAMAYIKDYIKTKDSNSIEKIGWEPLDNILKTTKGIVIYQETVMQILNKVFGFSLEDAELARRAIGKKKKEEIEKLKPQLYQQGEKLGVPKDVTDKIWKVMDDSASYQFNRSHSACYAVMSAITIWLKINHPKEFYKALIRMTKNEADAQEAFSKIASELPYFGIKLLPPDLNKSKEDVSIEGDNIRFGLTSIKGVSEKTLEKVLVFRGESFNSKIELFDAAINAKLGIGTLCSLIMAGALDSLIKDRAYSAFEAQVYNELTDKEKEYTRKYSPSYDNDIFKTLKAFENKEILNDKNKEVISEKRFTTLRRDITPYREVFLANSKHQTLVNFFFEKKFLGYSFTSDLITSLKKYIQNVDRIEDLTKSDINEYVSIAGIAKDVVKKKTREKKEDYIAFDLEDNGKIIRCMIFKRTLDEMDRNDITPPIDDEIISVYGQYKGDAIFVNEVFKVDAKIYFKFSELKKDKENNGTK